MVAARFYHSPSPSCKDIQRIEMGLRVVVPERWPVLPKNAFNHAVAEQDQF
jgi:hypothetical protein